MEEMLYAREAIVNTLIYQGYISAEDYCIVYDMLFCIDGIQITEKQLDMFFAGEYAYENNFMMSSLSDAWDIVDDVMSNGV